MKQRGRGRGIELWKKILSIISRVCILGIFILLLALVGCQIYGFIKYPSQIPKISHSYQIFIDLFITIITISGIAIAAIGYSIYLRISESMKEREEDFILYSTALLYTNMGFFHWQHYDIDYKIEEKDENKQNEYALYHRKFAIDRTERAYEMVQMLDVSERRNEKLKCQIMNNLGYYLATRKEEEDREFSKRCAYYIMKRIEKFPDKRKQWQNTSDYIIEKYGPANQFEL